MASSAEQALALGRVLVRHWWRGPLGQAKATGATTASASSGLLRLLFLVMMARYGHASASTAARLSDGSAALGVVALGLFGVSMGAGLRTSLPTPRGGGTALNAPMLDALPIGWPVRLLATLAEGLTLIGMTLGAALGAAPVTSAGEGAARVLVALGFAATALLTGEMAGRVLRVLVASPAALARLGGVVMVAALTSIVLVVGSPLIVKSSVGLASGRALASPFLVDTLPRLGGLMAAVAVLACVVIALAERRGYDRIDAVATTRTKQAASSDLSLERVDRVLGAREAVRTLIVVNSLLPYVLATGFVAVSRRIQHRSHRAVPEIDRLSGQMVQMMLSLVGYMTATLLLGLATRAVVRDLHARPLLAPLPIEPSDLLRGKASWLRRRGLWGLGALAVLFAAPLPTSLRIELGWRAAAMVAVLWWYADAAVSVAFLTRGVGGAGRGTTPSSIESILLLMPLLGVASAPHPFSALVAMLSGYLITFEARRTALMTVRWIDDGEGFERETPVWRALLVFTAFMVTQQLAQSVLDLSELPVGPRLAIGYTLSSVVLVLLTLRGRRDLGPVVPRPRRWALVPLGALAGLVTGGLGLVYLRALVHFGVDRQLVEPTASEFSWGFFLVVTLLAPPAEELFFRGWLQPAVREALPGGRRWAAPILTAFAFASVHPPVSFAPVFLVGLATGWLYQASGTIVVGVVAHIVHNVIAVGRPW